MMSDAVVYSVGGEGAARGEGVLDPCTSVYKKFCGGAGRGEDWMIDNADSGGRRLGSCTREAKQESPAR